MRARLTLLAVRDINVVLRANSNKCSLYTKYFDRFYTV